MTLTFLGHAAFVIETNGQRVLFDPYSREIGYLPVNQRADWVCLSHENPKWHSCLDDVAGDYEILRGLEMLDGEVQRGDLKFGAVRVWERPGEGENAMVWLESEGLRVLHMGDCGVLPDDETIETCGRVDILLALSGGFPTLSLDDLMAFIGKLAPKIILPMHFGVPGLAMSALPVGEVEARFEAKNQVRHENSTMDFSRQSLPRKTQLHLLRPLRIGA